MARDAHQKFLQLVNELEDWYADSVKAQTYEARIGSPDAGHAVLLRNRYYGPDWRRLWSAACGDRDAQDGIVHAIEEEIYGISHGPSKVGPASGLYRGTAEWRRAVGVADGSLRAVARRFGISHTEVRRLRLAEQGVNNGLA
jgi:hypothetical protein